MPLPFHREFFNAYRFPVSQVARVHLCRLGQFWMLIYRAEGIEGISLVKGSLKFAFPPFSPPPPSGVQISKQNTQGTFDPINNFTLVQSNTFLSSWRPPGKRGVATSDSICITGKQEGRRRRAAHFLIGRVRKATAHLTLLSGILAKYVLSD